MIIIIIDGWMNHRYRIDSIGLSCLSIVFKLRPNQYLITFSFIAHQFIILKRFSVQSHVSALCDDIVLIFRSAASFFSVIPTFSSSSSSFFERTPHTFLHEICPQYFAPPSFAATDYLSLLVTAAAPPSSRHRCCSALTLTSSSTSFSFSSFTTAYSCHHSHLMLLRFRLLFMITCSNPIDSAPWPPVTSNNDESSFGVPNIAMLRPYVALLLLRDSSFGSKHLYHLPSVSFRFFLCTLSTNFSSHLIHLFLFRTQTSCCQLRWFDSR